MRRGRPGSRARGVGGVRRGQGEQLRGFGVGGRLRLQSGAPDPGGGVCFRVDSGSGRTLCLKLPPGNWAAKLFFFSLLFLHCFAFQKGSSQSCRLFPELARNNIRLE